MERDYFAHTLSNYELRNVYNAYEFELFYQMNPEKSLHLNKKKCIGRKQNKVRITGMAVSNAGGDKIQMFIIGKSLNHCYFKGVKNKRRRYRAQKKAWMN